MKRTLMFMVAGLLLLSGCRCTTIQLFVEKDWRTERGFVAPDAHTRFSIGFDGSKLEVVD